MAGEIENTLSHMRQKRGLSASDLAKQAGVSRQTIYAMEAGSYVPNTAVALKLARALETRVEDLFALGEESTAPDPRSEQVELLPDSAIPQAGQPVQLCRVGKRIIASIPSAVQWYFPASDAVVVRRPLRRNKADVRVIHRDSSFRNRILVAGCDAGISVLARHVQTAGIELVLAHRNSSQALKLLKDGCVHVAGTHLHDDATGESNIPAVRRLFAKSKVAVISFAVWE